MEPLRPSASRPFDDEVARGRGQQRQAEDDDDRLGRGEREVAVPVPGPRHVEERRVPEADAVRDEPDRDERSAAQRARIQPCCWSPNAAGSTRNAAATMLASLRRKSCSGETLGKPNHGKCSRCEDPVALDGKQP